MEREKSSLFGFGKPLGPSVHYEGGQLQGPIARDTFSLLDREFVGRLLDQEERACSHRLKHDLYLEIQSLRVFRERIGDSTFKGSSTILSAFKFPAVLNFVEDFFADRRPESPQKNFIRTDDRNFEAAPNEEPFLIDDVLIGAADATRITSIAVHVRIHIREVRREAQRQASVHLATRCAFKCLSHALNLAPTTAGAKARVSCGYNGAAEAVPFHETLPTDCSTLLRFCR